jgi:hypothetical protein
MDNPPLTAEMGRKLDAFRDLIAAHLEETLPEKGPWDAISPEDWLSKRVEPGMADLAWAVGSEDHSRIHKAMVNHATRAFIQADLLGLLGGEVKS